ncbi:hypothetical protein, partial [Xanthomonas vasicola]
AGPHRLRRMWQQDRPASHGVVRRNIDIFYLCSVGFKPMAATLCAFDAGEADAAARGLSQGRREVENCKRSCY